MYLNVNNYFKIIDKFYIFIFGIKFSSTYFIQKSLIFIKLLLNKYWIFLISKRSYKHYRYVIT